MKSLEELGFVRSENLIGNTKFEVIWTKIFDEKYIEKDIIIFELVEKGLTTKKVFEYRHFNDTISNLSVSKELLLAILEEYDNLFGEE